MAARKRPSERETDPAPPTASPARPCESAEQSAARRVPHPGLDRVIDGQQRLPAGHPDYLNIRAPVALKSLEDTARDGIDQLGILVAGCQGLAVGRPGQRIASHAFDGLDTFAGIRLPDADRVLGIVTAGQELAVRRPAQPGQGNLKLICGQEAGAFAGAVPELNALGIAPARQGLAVGRPDQGGQISRWGCLESAHPIAGREVPLRQRARTRLRCGENRLAFGRPDVDTGRAVCRQGAKASAGLRLPNLQKCPRGAQRPAVRRPNDSPHPVLIAAAQNPEHLMRIGIDQVDSG